MSSRRGTGRRRNGDRPRLRVALVGADGAGKSTITEMLERERELLPFPVKRIYMGVNLEASSLMLPTTRLLLMLKRFRGGRPDLGGGRPEPVTGRLGWRRRARHGARLTVWVLEEWLRQLVASGYTRRGYVVVFDRHFFADYYHSDIAPPPAAGRSTGTMHGWLLTHVYPKPDLVICLDAPAEVLYARKHEVGPEWLEQRRRQYLGLAEAVPAFVVVDADRPLEQVYSDVLDSIRAEWKEEAA